MEYFRAFSSEFLKLKRSWAFTLSVAAPLSATLFIFVATMSVSKGTWNDVWIYYLRGVVWSWLLMLTPLYVALLAALLANTDHSAGTWKLLLSQPISRAPLYIAKLAVGLVLMAGSQIVLAVSAIGTGFLLRRLRPQIGSYSQGIEIPHLLAMLALAYLAGMLILAIQTWLSMRSANFALSLGIAIFSVVPSILGMRREILQKTWPWLYPFDAVRIAGLQSRDAVQHFWSAGHLVLISLIGATLVTALGLWDFSRREIT
jgi:hypothetical protein